MSIYRLRARVRRNKTIFVLFNGPRESFDARICILKSTYCCRLNYFNHLSRFYEDNVSHYLKFFEFFQDH